MRTTRRASLGGFGEQVTDALVCGFGRFAPAWPLGPYSLGVYVACGALAGCCLVIFSSREFSVRVRASVSRVLAVFVGGLSLAVMVSGVQTPVYADPTGPAGAAASSEASVSPSVAKAGAGELSRPDAVSAMVTARATGRRVEDLSQRTELTTTWANPDGTWTMEGHAGIQRFRDADGDWVNVDLNFGKEADGSVVPGGHPLGCGFRGPGVVARSRSMRARAGRFRCTCLVFCRLRSWTGPGPPTLTSRRVWTWWWSRCALATSSSSSSISAPPDRCRGTCHC